MNVCKFCGAKCTESVFRDYLSAYYCGSWHDGAGQWSQGVACRDRCQEMLAQHEATAEILKVQLESEIKLKQILRKRVAAAIEALKTIDRYSIEGVYDVGAIGKYDKGGDWVHFEDLEAVVDILQGNSPEIPEGSP